MLQKFLKSENKIELAEKLEDDENIKSLNVMIFETEQELEEAEKIKKANVLRIKELDEEIESFNSELNKLQQPENGGNLY